MPGTAVSRRRMAAFVILVFATTSCDQVVSTEPAVNQHQHLVASAAASPIGGSGGALVKEVHALSARFNSTKQAEAAGYVVDPFCVESPAGGMGHHWANGALIDPVFDAKQPEVMLYAPDRNGTMKLVAVEYVVINIGQPRPAFDGQLFDVGGAPVPVPHWTLHVWLGKPNPSGLFAPFNPDVDCP